MAVNRPSGSRQRSAYVNDQRKGMRHVNETCHRPCGPHQLHVVTAPPPTPMPTRDEIHPSQCAQLWAPCCPVPRQKGRFAQTALRYIPDPKHLCAAPHHTLAIPPPWPRCLGHALSVGGTARRGSIDGPRAAAFLACAFLPRDSGPTASPSFADPCSDSSHIPRDIGAMICFLERSMSATVLDPPR